MKEISVFWFLFVFRFGSRKYVKDGFKGRGLILAWDCILVELKVMEVDLYYSATKTEVSCPGKSPPDTGVHRKRTLQSAAINSKLSGAHRLCQRGTQRGIRRARDSRHRRTAQCPLPPSGIGSEMSPAHLPDSLCESFSSAHLGESLIPSYSPGRIQLRCP